MELQSNSYKTSYNGKPAAPHNKAMFERKHLGYAVYAAAFESYVNFSMWKSNPICHYDMILSMTSVAYLSGSTCANSCAYHRTFLAWDLGAVVSSRLYLGRNCR